jgi:hypothetical protein
MDFAGELTDLEDGRLQGERADGAVELGLGDPDRDLHSRGGGAFHGHQRVLGHLFVFLRDLHLRLPVTHR